MVAHGEGVPSSHRNGLCLVEASPRLAPTEFRHNFVDD
jgi:hypothetical protein